MLEWRSQEKPDVLHEHPVPVAHCPPQIQQRVVGVFHVRNISRLSGCITETTRNLHHTFTLNSLQYALYCNKRGKLPWVYEVLPRVPRISLAKKCWSNWWHSQSRVRMPRHPVRIARFAFYAHKYAGSTREFQFNLMLFIPLCSSVTVNTNTRAVNKTSSLRCQNTATCFGY